MKRNLRLLVLSGLAITLMACRGGDTPSTEPSVNPSVEPSVAPSEEKQAVKIGLICLHDDSSTYDANFIKALREAVADLGDKVIFEENCLLTGINEDSACAEACEDLIAKGCNVIFADSFGHDPYMLAEAQLHPDVHFCHATGTKTTVNETLDNYHNAFASIYEGRFMAGYAAGLKLFEQQANANPENFGECMVGYVGAFPYAEVKSGYTSWFLGLREALSNHEVDPTKVSMKVQFTNSWYDPDAENSAANNLIQQGAVLISQHADSMGAPTACELAGVPNVTYNIETGEECEATYLAYSRINWAPYYKAVVEAVYNGTAIEGELNHNWAGTMETGSVEYNINWANLTSDADKLADYMEEVELMEAKVRNGSIEIFDTSKFTVNEQKPGLVTDTDGHVTSYLADVIDDGTYTGETEVIVTDVSRGITYFAESYFRSAPYFDLDIAGIEL